MNDWMTDAVTWLTLKSVNGIGNLLFRRLLDQFKSPDRVLRGAMDELTRVKGITPQLAQAIQRHPNPDLARKEIDRTQQAGFSIITQAAPAYPTLLLQIPDPPPVLYVNGAPPNIHNTIAVVGSRKATAYGRNTTQALCKGLAEHGMTVVSGMALGIDTAAHQGALAGGGPTIAVLGSGLNNIYPYQNLKLSRQIAMNGCVMTEFALDAQPEPHHFPMRNRIISGMSLGTVVVEAAQRSGSLITARLAAEQNREVFAVPGSIHAQTTRGTHDLIKQGAKLVETIEDILVEIRPHLVNPKPLAEQADHGDPLPALTAEEEQILALLDDYPVHIDTLVRQLRGSAGPTGLSTGVLAGTLSQLELKGMISQEPGKYFLRRPPAQPGIMPLGQRKDVKRT